MVVLLLHGFAHDQCLSGDRRAKAAMGRIDRFMAEGRKDGLSVRRVTTVSPVPKSRGTLKKIPPAPESEKNVGLHPAGKTAGGPDRY
jgi:hypothetical protein